MKKMLLIVLLAAAGMPMAPSPLFAHHNQANFNRNVVTTVTGTVKEYHWMNPHSMLILVTRDEKGEFTDWSIELAPPNSLQRDNGWSRTTFKAGDQITVDGNAYKDGRKIMRPLKFVMPDGREVKGRF